jgi:hypothetical protein
MIRVDVCRVNADCRNINLNEIKIEFSYKVIVHNAYAGLVCVYIMTLEDTLLSNFPSQTHIT